MIEAASSALPARVRFTSSHSSPIATQQASAISTSLAGVRTPARLSTPPISGRIVTGLSVNRYAMPTWIMMPQSSVPVSTKISVSSRGIARGRWIGRTTTK